jgi:hypothetical protein
MSEMPLLSPTKYRQLLSESELEDPESFLELAKRADARRDPRLADFPETYELTVPSAVKLYRSGHSGDRAKILCSMLGPRGTETFWRRLGEAGRHAHATRDWRTLGSLAYRMDVELARLAAESTSPAGESENSLTVGRFVSALRDVWFRALGELAEYGDGRAMVEAAMGYFSSLPASFPGPADLISGTQETESSSTNSWPLLRQFWETGLERWTQHPDMRRELEQLKHPALRTWIENLPIPKPMTSEVAPEEVPAKRRGPRNHFAKLVGKERVHVLRLQPAPNPDPDPNVEAEITTPRALRPRKKWYDYWNPWNWFRRAKQS